MKKPDTVATYPNPNVPNEVKETAAYILPYIKTAYHDYINDQYLGYSNRAQKINNKRYRLSEEDVMIYKTRMNITGDTSHLNLDFSPVSIIPKFVDTVVNSILDQGFHITVTARDALSNSLKEGVRNDLTAEMDMINFNQVLSEAMGYDVTNPDAPTSPEEVEVIMDVDYKDDMEDAFELGIREIRRMNNAKEIDRYVVDDIVTCGEGVMKVHLTEKGEIKHEYIDAVNFIRSFSMTPDNRRLKHAGHITKMTLGELRSRISSEEGYTEADWEEIATRVTNRKSGFRAGSAVYVNNSSESSAWYDSLDVDVVELEFVDFNYDQYEYKETEYGYDSIHPRGADYKLPQNSKRRRSLVLDTHQVVYKGSWILGTDYLFDYGKAHNISINTDDFYTANLSYIVYTYYGKSIVQKILPYAKQIQLIHLKMQQLAMKVRPEGIAIDVSALENAVANGNGGFFQPLELSEIYDQTGNLFYRSINEDPDMGRSGPPITQLSTSVRDGLVTMIDLYNHYAQQIREVSGVNEARDGGNIHPKTAVAIHENSLRASNNATYSVNSAFYNIVERAAERTIEYFQDALRDDEIRDKYERILGTTVVEVLERIKDVPIDMMAVDMEFEPTIDEQQALDRQIEVALNNQLLDIEDVIAIKNIEHIGVAQRVLILKKRKRAEAAKKAAQEAQQAQAQAIEQERQAELQKIQAETQIKTEADVNSYAKKAEIDVQKEMALMQMKQQLMQQEINGKISVAEATGRAGMEKQSFVEDRKDKRDKNQKTMESSLIEQRKDRLPEQDFNPQEPMVENDIANIQPQNQVVQ